MSRVTIADVALRAGVSKTAVSFAFNNPERLGQATLERVLGVAHDLGYTPHPAARALSMRRSGTIGVLIPQRLSAVFANPFVSELIQGLGELCEEHDLTLLLVPPLDGSLEGAIRQASVDGFISLGLSRHDRALEVLDAIGIPTVLVDSEDSAEHPVVNVDDRGGAEAAARHVLELGHRRACGDRPAADARSGRTHARPRPAAWQVTAPPFRTAARRRRYMVTAGHIGRGGRARVRVSTQGQAAPDRGARDERHGGDRRHVSRAGSRAASAGRPFGRRLRRYTGVRSGPIRRSRPSASRSSRRAGWRRAC